MFILSQDIARLTFVALRNENINGKLLTLAGPRAWTTQEVNKHLASLCLTIAFFVLNMLYGNQLYMSKPLNLHSLLEKSIDKPSYALCINA